MTDPNVPLRFEFSVEVPGTPDQVWAAIATADGISAWMMPTDLEEREGGAVAFHMGPEMSSEGTVTGWEPPRRIAYEENWAQLVGKDPSSVSPLVSEFLVEATSGGTCVVRVVTSAFGTGADWEQEFFADMAKGWTPMFDHLRLYLTYFPGQKVTTLEVSADAPGPPAAAMAAIRHALALESTGQPVEIRDTKGELERIGDEHLLVRITDPVPGMLALFAHRADENKTMARLAGYLFSDDAPAYVEREQPAWQRWLDGLAQGQPV